MQRQLQEERQYVPLLQLQFVLEHQIHLDGTPVLGKRERENTSSSSRRKAAGASASGAVGGVVTTRRFSAPMWEMMLAMLPLRAADASVKIRLVQFPPPLRSSRARRAVDEALGRATAEPHQANTPLCIGVGKITLKELLSIRGGVRMALQAKKGIANAVESLNLSTTNTSVMLGGDVGGSAVVTVEVTAFSYGKASLSKLLHFPSTTPRGPPSRETSALLALHGGDSEFLRRKHSNGSLIDDDEVERSTNSISSSGVYESPVTRFFFIPYLAVVNVLVSVHDVVSWRRPSRTLLVLAMLLVSMAADVLPAVMVLMLILTCSKFFAIATFLYHEPLNMHDSREVGGGGASSRHSHRSRRGSRGAAFVPHSYIYGRQNKLLNALIRSQILYSNGLQEESFYEIAFVFHLLRRRKNIFMGAAVVSTLFLILPLEFSLFLLLCGALVVYPVTLRISIPRSAKRRRRLFFSLSALADAWRLSHPMKVTRILHLASGGGSGTRSSVGGNSLDHGVSRRESSTMAMPSNNTRRPPSINIPDSFPIHHERFASLNSMRDPLGPTTAATALNPGYPSRLSKRQQTQNAAKLSFAVISLTSVLGSGGDPSQLLSLLRAHFDRVHFIHQQSPEVGGSSTAPRQAPFPAFSQTFVNSGSSHTKEFDTQYATFLSDTIQLLSHIRIKTILQVSVTPTSGMPTLPDSVVRLDTLARLNWLLEQGEDDGITSTLIAMPYYSFTVSHIAKQAGASSDARALAALAAYLLQGARLSIYTRGRANRNCCIILPLQMGSARFERYRPLHSAHASAIATLVNALEEVWNNSPQPGSSSTGTGTGTAAALTVTPDMVLQIVKNYIGSIVLRSGSSGSVRDALSRYSSSMQRDASMTFQQVPCSFEEMPSRRGSPAVGGGLTAHGRTFSSASALFNNNNADRQK